MNSDKFSWDKVRIYKGKKIHPYGSVSALVVPRHSSLVWLVYLLVAFQLTLWISFTLILFFWFQGDPLLVKVDKLTSADAVLPYAYYSIPFCCPDATFDTAGYFGDFLGNQLKDSAYQVSGTILQLIYIWNNWSWLLSTIL